MVANPAELLGVQLAAFKNRDFDFIVKNYETGETHEKQRQALEILTDDSTVEFLYGGAAGGAKSWTGCCWLTFSAMLYPNTVWFVGRATLIDLRDSTMKTFKKVFETYGITENDVYFHGGDHYYQFSNGSQIRTINLFYLPSEPMYERYGSKEYTGGWIEEAGEVNFGAFDTLKTRIGRQLNDKYGILRKLFVTANPKQNWLYTIFYKGALEGTMKPYQKYLSATVYENCFIEKGYVDALSSTTDETRKERLLKGNWDYDSNPRALIRPAAAMRFLDGVAEVYDDRRYISADVALHGSDCFVVIVWEGWTIIDVLLVPEKIDAPFVEAKLREIAEIYGIMTEHIVYDNDGLGSFLRGYLRGAVPFSNNGAPIIAAPDIREMEALKREHVPAKLGYEHLKTQCLFEMARLINDGIIKMSKAVMLTMEQRERLKIELTMIQRDKVDDERTLHTLPKEIVKQKIGHSPDMTDAMMMRVIFSLAKIRTSPYSGLSNVYSTSGV